MKNFLCVLILVSSLSGCSSSSSTLPAGKLESLKRQDDLVLNSLHDEPQRQGTKQTVTEAGITTEIWKQKAGHGSDKENVETVIYKNGKLISHSYSDGESGYVGSKQFQNEKVIQYSEEMNGKATVIYFDAEENIRARLRYDGKNSECLNYEKGKNPRPKDMDECEEMFNTSP